MTAISRPQIDGIGFSNPFAQPSYPSSGFTKAKIPTNRPAHVDDELAISYEYLADRPSYMPDIHVDSQEAVLPRNQLTNESSVPRMERVDSVFDVYAELYAEDGGEDDSDELQRGTSGRASYQFEHDSVSESDEDESTEPWDERGKTGLYGGGGRGADDRETGWVSDFTFALISPGSAGQEEDLRYAGSEDGGEDSRSGSQPITYSQQAPRDDGTGSHRRCESSETVQSSTGPATPPDSYAMVSPDTGVGEKARSPRATPGLPPPIHTVDAARVKKSSSNAKIPTPSAPIPAGPNVSLADRTERPRAKAGGFKWPARAKKPPTISAPILPEGFVESLGMETFPLYPGVKAPPRASPNLAAASLQVAPPTPREAPSPNPQGQRSASTRKAAPHESQVVSHMQPAPRADPPGPLTRAISTTPSAASRLGAVREEAEPAPTSRTQTPQRGQHDRSDSAVTLGSGFRDPWSAAGGTTGSQSSIHSYRTRTPGGRSSYHGGSERASLASTVAGIDPHYNAATPPAAEIYQPPAVEAPPPPASPVVTGSRHDSLSSTYSEVSEAHNPSFTFSPPTSDGYRQDFTPFSTTAHLRGAGAATLGSTSRKGVRAVQPLKVHRRRSSAYSPGYGDDESKRSTLAGDVVWGGPGTGGPRDMSTPVHGAAPSPLMGRAASPFAQYAPTIGSTGFRNPFG